MVPRLPHPIYWESRWFVPISLEYALLFLWCCSTCFLSPLSPYIDKVDLELHCPMLCLIAHEAIRVWIIKDQYNIKLGSSTTQISFQMFSTHMVLASSIGLPVYSVHVHIQNISFITGSPIRPVLTNAHCWGLGLGLVLELGLRLGLGLGLGIRYLV